MAKHEFGIMTSAPNIGETFDDYTPEKYNCIVIDDELVERIDPLLADCDFYWHSLSRPANGLAYCGITLIPPQSMASVLSVIRSFPDLEPLMALVEKARQNGQYIIHFGL